jgi:OmpR family response regulator RpaB|tara:strand:- start:10870 stop:11583 length:714 start_codon:yes stop_codon:yes gene_type:complete
VEVYNEKILVIDGDIDIRQILATRLTILGYKVFLSSNGKDALVSFNKEQPDLIILDLILPKIDGYDVCRTIRSNSQIPILIITSLANIADRISGLELGADDYITKPFSPKELEARIRCILHRSTQKAENPSRKLHKKFQIGNLVIDLNTRIISTKYSKTRLTFIENNLLELLIENAGHKLSRQDILSNVWGYTPERYVDTRIVDAHISRLRTKIKVDPTNPNLIITIRGIGYMFQKY